MRGDLPWIAYQVIKCMQRTHVGEGLARICQDNKMQ